MTLALSGKSKQRQGALVLAGIVAVLLAIAVGMGFTQWRNASAAPTNIEPTYTFSGGNDNDVPGWTDENSDSSDASVNDGAVRLEDGAAIYKTVNTTGFAGIFVEFDCRGDGDNDPSDNLVVEYRLQSSGGWTNAATFDTDNDDAGECDDDTYVPLSVSFPGSADDLSTFQLRFRSTSHFGDGEDVNLDNIAIKGEPIVIPSPNANPGFQACAPADILLVIDSSGSIGGGLAAMKTSLTGAIGAIEGNSQLSGSNWRAVSFADPSSVTIGSSGGWQADPATELYTFINNLTSDGYTPTADGIAQSMTSTNGDPLQNVMLIITDGSPNVPLGGNAPPAKYYIGGADAVTQANTARGTYSWNTILITFGPGDNDPAAIATNAAVKAGLKGSNGLEYNAPDAAALEQALKDALLTDCGPTVVKKFVSLNPAGTEASWTVEVTNNSQTTESFHLVEEVTATLYDTQNCNNSLSLPSTTNPPAEPGWLCEINSGVKATYFLTTPATYNECDGGTFVNEYYVRYTGPGSPFEGTAEHTIPGNPEACNRDIEIHKFFLDTGPYTPTEADLPPITGLPNGAVLKSSGFVDPPDNTHYRWVYTIPFDADTSNIDEGTPPDGWVEITGEGCVGELNGLTADYNAQFQPQEIVALRYLWVFCNAPYGTLIINKVDGTSDGSELWTFDVPGLPAEDVNGDLLDAPIEASENTPFEQSLIPLGTNLLTTEVEFRSETACATANTYFTTVIAPADQVLSFPGEEIVWTFSNQPCGTLGTGGILIEKWEDVNGDGVIGAGDQRLPGWTFTTTGTGIPPANQVQVTNASGQIVEYISGFDAGTVLTTSETLQPGWVFVGSDVDGGPISADASPDVVIVGGKTIVVRFLNERARVNIVATKTIFNNANPAGANGGAGWTFTLSGCGQGPSQKTTDASGSVSWNNLPAAINCTYTVTETAKAGWVADDISKQAAPINDGQTVTLGFVNRQIQGCTNINDCPPTTPTTATPTNTPVTPTNTPETGETPTEEPSPTETAIAGEKTPGPGDQATPIAPDTGDGFGSTAAGWNILLIIAGLIAISGGLSMIALGRRPVRND